MSVWTNRNDEKNKEKVQITTFIKPITWIFSHINEYHDRYWTDTIIIIHFTPERVLEGYYIDTILNIGHQGTAK